MTADEAVNLKRAEKVAEIQKIFVSQKICSLYALRKSRQFPPQTRYSSTHVRAIFWGPYTNECFPI